MNKTDIGSIKTLIFAILIIPVVVYLALFSMKRHGQFESKAQECAETCTEQGYLKSEFKWSALTQADCKCADPVNPEEQEESSYDLY